MPRRFFTLDVFTGEALAGNPLAVVLDCDGLDGAALLAATQDAAIKAELAASTEAAAARGAFGIPTMWVDGAIYFGKERLPQIEAQLTA